VDALPLDLQRFVTGLREVERETQGKTVASYMGLLWGLPNFRDGTGLWKNILVLHFQDARTVMDIPTCLKSRITETENLTWGVTS